jgi:hypothetical protein
MTRRDNQPEKGPLRATPNTAIITTAATPDSHPDCRALLIQIAALQADDPSKSIEHITPQSSGKDYIHRLGNLTMLPVIPDSA